jgi:transposase-like protein
VLKDREALMAHFDLPAEHWVHLRATNAIKSTFATVRLRTNKTKVRESVDGLAMAYKLLEAARARWRCVIVLNPVRIATLILKVRKNQR